MYYLCIKDHSGAVEFSHRHRGVKVIVNSLNHGLWFDAFYAALLRSTIVPASSWVAGLQKSIIGASTALVLFTVAVVFLLFAWGVF